MLHGASPDEAVSARGSIAIRYRSPLWFSNEHGFYRAETPEKFLDLTIIQAKIIPDPNRKVECPNGLKG